MSKKKFKAGLESLFGTDDGKDQLPGIRPLLVEEKEEKRERSTKKHRKKRTNKNFTSDLEDLFHSALEQEYKENIEKKRITKAKGRNTTAKKRNERPVIGIDALIRRTSTETKDVFDIGTPLKKRLTFALEKHKIERLKSIAKSKKAYLKDVMDEIISDYLNEHPSKKANPN